MLRCSRVDVRFAVVCSSVSYGRFSCLIGASDAARAHKFTSFRAARAWASRDWTLVLVVLLKVSTVVFSLPVHSFHSFAYLLDRVFGFVRALTSASSDSVNSFHFTVLFICHFL